MIPENMQGDKPCNDCKTEDNPVWFTDDVFWNDVAGQEVRKILCISCFIVRAESKYKVASWRLIPNWKWQKL